jgi:hypothetical protein
LLNRSAVAVVKFSISKHFGIDSSVVLLSRTLDPKVHHAYLYHLLHSPPRSTLYLPRPRKPCYRSQYTPPLPLSLQTLTYTQHQARQNSSSATATTSSVSSTSSYNAATDTQSGVPAGVGTGSSGSGEGSSGQNSNTSTSGGVVRYGEFCFGCDCVWRKTD